MDNITNIVNGVKGENYNLDLHLNLYDFREISYIIFLELKNDFTI
jgi:hypothetical protein